MRNPKKAPKTKKPKFAPPAQAPANKAKAKTKTKTKKDTTTTDPEIRAIDIDTDVGSVSIDTGNKFMDFAVFVVIAILLAAVIYGSFF